jgi:hypothetical protein
VYFAISSGIASRTAIKPKAASLKYCKVYGLLRLNCAAKAACQSLMIVIISSSFAACQQHNLRTCPSFAPSVREPPGMSSQSPHVISPRPRFSARFCFSFVKTIFNICWQFRFWRRGNQLLYFDLANQLKGDARARAMSRRNEPKFLLDPSVMNLYDPLALVSSATILQREF